MARPKTYIIQLNEEERAALNKTIHNKKTCRTVLKRCQILLELDEIHGTGLTHAQLAHSYAVCPATITNIIRSYVKKGIKDIIRYNISPNSSAALRKVDGRTEAHIIQMAYGPVLDGHSHWTLGLLEEKVRIKPTIINFSIHIFIEPLFKIRVTSTPLIFIQRIKFKKYICVIIFSFVIISSP